MKVLIVEDNPDHRFILRKKLETYYSDIHIHNASSVEEAIQRLETDTYKMILLDYMLRGSSGIDLVKWINEKKIDTPVIMLTSIEDVEIAVQAIKLGAYDYICKNKESLDKLPLLLDKVAQEYTLKREIESERRKVDYIFNSMIDWISIVNEDYTVIFINRSLREELGEPGKKKCYKYLYQRDEPCSFCKWPNIKEENTVRWELRREDGKTFDIISSPLLNPDGSLSKMEILRDVTRRKEVEEKYKLQIEETGRANEELKRAIAQLKRTQEQLIQSEKLAAIGELVSGVAHELNNPLFSAMGYTELLLMDDMSVDKQKEKLNSILESINRARWIIRDLLRFARLEKVEKESIAIEEVIQKTVSLRNYELKVNNIEVEYEQENDLPTIIGNFVRLQQVFLNIIINAEHAITETGNSGLIKILCVYDEEQKKLIIEIANNGPEIPPENIGNIFDPFFTTKEVGKGTGLGLSTSYGIVKDHGGDITVKSDPNWTTFTINLPVQLKPSIKDHTMPLKKSADSQAMRAHGESILVVDDEPVIVNLLNDFFTRKGFTVHTAASGDEALVKLESSDVQIIISDIKMPGMDGKRFYKEIKIRKPGLLDKLLFITGDTISSETRTFLKETGCVHLKKPFSFNEITDAVNTIRGEAV